MRKSQTLKFPMTPDRLSRTYALARSVEEDLGPIERDRFISEVGSAFASGYGPQFETGKAEGAAQVRTELASIAKHASFSIARDLALGLYFATEDAAFVIGVLNGIGRPARAISQDTAPALFLRQNGYSPEKIGAAIAGRE